MKTLYFNSTFGALSLSSYLSDQYPRQVQFRNLSFDVQTISECLQDENAVFCLSVGSIGDLRLVENLFFLVRQTGIKAVGFPKFILGGAAFSAINCLQLLNYYPEISYIVIGEGYAALETILNSEPEQKIIMGHAYPSPGNVLLNHSLNWHPQRPIPVSLGETNCSWGRCRFCHHLDDENSRRLSVETFCDRLVEYYQKYNWKHFYIFDNHLEPEELESILRILSKRKVKPILDVFGMRFKKSFLPLGTLLSETDIVRFIGWGLEIYSQSALNLYRKGIKLDSVKPILQTAAQGGAQSIVYILLGLPGCKESDYSATYDFLAQHLKENGLIHNTLLSWFLMGPHIEEKMRCDRINLKLKIPYELNNYFGNPSELKGVQTTFHKFDAWCDETQEWISRDQMFLRQREVLAKLFKLPNTAYDYRAFFLASDTWRKFWGNRFMNWVKDHPAPISRMSRRTRVLSNLSQVSVTSQQQQAVSQ